ncbi:hypothetical protein PQH03_19325 [Ralstonia insidiosa]|jgi:hypothetical protein|uniref:hypothetical protein n=1 Tax=Ralstonia TaxID=48736 RepID=UPI000664B848|nr:hypothetical protein [Ralstonia insidiosa]KMW46711.1 hypothetical protein AC240_12280 [Ralstonia sp. MD27]MBX3771313.1 hypothetical protein [Ralstonia pickettii]NOZ99586.1 hypothetical protein [Betaproteobacteria bacterium]MBA9855440.1 hypothetical protein [Ralstonia insidiosa]MBA9869323.1 hypothetical protein [Ralstonia insidiosa]
MRWQFKAGAILAAAVLVFAGVRLFSADAADAQPADPPRQAAAATPPSPAPAPAGTPPPQAAPAHQPPPPPERPLPPRFTDYLAREYPNSAATRQALTQIAYGWSQAVNDVRGPQDAKLAGNEIAKGIACALGPGVLARTGVDQQTMLDRIKAARAVMLDSDNDTTAYLHFQALAGGQYFDDPGAASCSFDPATLPN